MNGLRAAMREKELTRPLETGDPPPAGVFRSAKKPRRHAHKVNRHWIRRKLGELVGQFAGAFGDEIVEAVPQLTEEELRARHDSWMYKRATCAGSVTVTAGHVFFNGRRRQPQQIQAC